MTSAHLRALELRRLIERDLARFSALPDLPGQRVHCLFAGLYRETITQWLAAIEQMEAPLFTQLAVRRFYDIYKASVPDRMAVCPGRPGAPVPAPWQRYHRFSGRATMGSAISVHLAILVLGARAHICHDLRDAFAWAMAEYRRQTGAEADLDNERRRNVGPVSVRVFYTAALDYVASHRSRQRGWRYLVLTLWGLSLKALRPIWIGVLEGWRARAWDQAIASRRQTAQPDAATGPDAPGGAAPTSPEGR